MVGMLTIVGGGGHALVIAEAARLAGIPLAGFLDDDPHAMLTRRGIPWLGRLQEVERLRTAAMIGLGNVPARRGVIDAMEGCEWGEPVVHPSAVVSDAANVGHGSYVGARAVVNPLASVGRHAIINTGAIVEHECDIGENVHVAPGVILGGLVKIGSDTLIGIGARVLVGVRIGSGCVVGAGAVVLHDLDDGVTAVGAPARVIRTGRQGAALPAAARSHHASFGRD